LAFEGLGQLSARHGPAVNRTAGSGAKFWNCRLGASDRRRDATGSSWNNRLARKRRSRGGGGGAVVGRAPRADERARRTIGSRFGLDSLVSSEVSGKNGFKGMWGRGASHRGTGG